MDSNKLYNERWEFCKKWIPSNPFLNVLYQNKDIIKDLDKIKSFIETGTFMGNTSDIFAKLFSKVHTIEKNLTVEKSKNHEIIQKNNNNINFITGDSPNEIKNILTDNPQERFLILLDAHDGITSPLTEELKTIKKYSEVSNHVIIIDDCVDLGSGNWPTIEEMFGLIYDINKNYTIMNTHTGRDIHLIY